MRKAPNPKIFLVLALGTFVAGAGAVYFAYSGLSDVQAKVADLKSQVKPTKDIQKELDDTAKDLTETALKLKHLEAGVPDFAYVPTMLTDLETAGKASGLDVTGVKPMPAPVVAPKQGEKQERKPYDELIIEVKGRGSYASVVKFVGALQAFPKIVAAKSVTLIPKTDPTKGMTGLDVTMELKAFVFSQPTATTPGTPAAGAAPTTGTTPTGTTPAATGTTPPATGTSPATPGTAPAKPTKPTPAAPVKTASTHKVSHEG